MDDETAPAAGRVETGDPTDARPGRGGQAGSDAPPRRRRPRPFLQPWEGLTLLERQWADPTPLERLEDEIVTLALTTTGDPSAWDYLGAMTGAPARQTAKTGAVWLAAQLAADATTVGRTYRPTVELLPAARLWHVVRAIGNIIICIDGPGFPTPLAAVSAATRRYGAELERDLDRRTETVVGDDEPQMRDESAVVDGEAAEETQAPASPEDPDC